MRIAVRPALRTFAFIFPTALLLYAVSKVLGFGFAKEWADCLGLSLTFAVLYAVLTNTSMGKRA